MTIEGDWLAYSFAKDTPLRVLVVMIQLPGISETNFILNLRF
jgi:hypothetical protein